MVIRLKKAQMHQRPDAVLWGEMRRIAGLLRDNDPTLDASQSEDIARAALWFAQDTGLRHSDSVVGLAFLIYFCGLERFAQDPCAAGVLDKRRSEAERKTMIHAELVRRGQRR